MSEKFLEVLLSRINNEINKNQLYKNGYKQKLFNYV